MIRHESSVREVDDRTWVRTWGVSGSRSLGWGGERIWASRYIHGRVRGKSGKGQGFGSLGVSHVFFLVFLGKINIHRCPSIPLSPWILYPCRPSSPTDPLSLWTLYHYEPCLSADHLSLWILYPSGPPDLLSLGLSIPPDSLSLWTFYPSRSFNP